MASISLEERTEFFSYVRDISRSILCQVARHVESLKYITSYKNYPIATQISKNNGWPSTSTLSPYDFFSYKTNGFQYADYSSLLSIRNENDKICLYGINKFKELKDYVSKKENIFSRIWISTDSDKTDIVLLLIGNIIDRYIATTEQYEYVEETFQRTYDTVMNGFFIDKFEFEICVPILFIDFEEDYIPICENVSIRRMTQDFIRSKYFIGNYDGFSERVVIDCATHMLALEGYSLDNENFLSDSSLGYMSVYPTKLIDTVFSSIRSLTNFPTGYAQFVVLPTNNWMPKNNKGNLLGLEGARARVFPDYFLEYYWSKPHNLITAELGQKVATLASTLIGRNDNALQIACNRLNRSMLRSSVEDSILDAIIGLEVLLSDNDKGELTYKISSRMATISILMPDCPFSAREIQKSVIQLYRYRSDIVHSRKSRPATEIIEVRQELEMTPVDLAIKYLGMAIEILANNPEYLNTKKIDELMMIKLSE